MTTNQNNRLDATLIGIASTQNTPARPIQGLTGLTGVSPQIAPLDAILSLQGLAGVQPMPFTFPRHTREDHMGLGQYQLSPTMQQLSRMSTKEFLEFAAAKRKDAEAQSGATTLMGLALDSSTSMDSIKEIALGGYNASVDNAITSAPTIRGGVYACQTLFSHVVRVSDIAPACELKKHTMSSYIPSGGTALFDAIGMTIEKLLTHPGVWHGQTGVFLNIVTDGQEIDSRYYSAGVLASIIDKLEATGNWTFALMATEGVESLAQLLKLRRSNVSGFNPQSMASSQDAFSAVAGATQSYMASRSAGFTSANNLYAGRD